MDKFKHSVLALSVFTAMSASALTKIDSDRDGLSDEYEIANGLDHKYFDSDMDGIPDYDEENEAVLAARSAGLSETSSSCSDVSPMERDDDGDGIPNFLETYGVYYDNNGLHLAKRIMSNTEYDNFKNAHPSKSFTLALNSLESSGYITIEGTNRIFDLKQAGAILCEAFSSEVETSTEFEALTTYNTATIGSVGHILKTLLSEANILSNTEHTYYFLNAAKRSSDNDPFSDYDELTNNNTISGIVNYPYNLPNVATMPLIQAHLLGFGITPTGTISNVEGHEITNSWAQTVSHSTEQTTSWEVSTSVESEISFFPSVSASIETSIGGSTAYSINRETGTEESKGFNWSTEITNEQSCVAELRLKLNVVNEGSAPAKNIGSLITVLVAGKAISSAKLEGTISYLGAKEETGEIIFPSNEKDAICLDADTLRAIQNGSSISIDMSGSTSETTDEYNGPIVTENNWEFYADAIKNATTMFDLDIVLNGERTTKTFHMTPGNAYHKATIREALNQLLANDIQHSLSLPDCRFSDINEESLCLDNDHLNTTSRTAIRTRATYDNGSSIPLEGKNGLASMIEQELAEHGGPADMLNLTLKNRWNFSFVGSVTDVATGKPSVLFTSYKLNNGILLAAVKDELGVAKVEYCAPAPECTEMMQEGNSKFYKISGIRISNAENFNTYTIRVTNTRGESSEAGNLFSIALIKPYIERINDTIRQQEQQLDYIETALTDVDIRKSLTQNQWDGIKADIEDNIEDLKAAIEICKAAVNLQQCIESSDQHLSPMHYVMPELWKEGFGMDDGWRVGKHPRLLGDIDGDGDSDIVAFGDSKTFIALAEGHRFTDAQSLGWFHYNHGWRVNKHPRMLADVNGDGRKDIVGFANAGVEVSIANPNATPANSQYFNAREFWSDDFGYNVSVYPISARMNIRYSTDLHKPGGSFLGFYDNYLFKMYPRYIADVNGDGMDDVVGISENGVRVALSHRTGFDKSKKVLAGSFSREHGWSLERHLVFLSDINNDKRADIVGFGESAVYVALATGLGGFEDPKAVLRNFTPASGGWDFVKHPRTMADINGDGCQDIVGFGNAHVFASLSNCDGTFAAVHSTNNHFSYNKGWISQEEFPRYLGDVNGDGKADIVGFGSAGVYVALSNGTAFEPATLEVQNFGKAHGWNINHPRQLADINGDGRLDIVGFKDRYVHVANALYSQQPAALGE